MTKGEIRKQLEINLSKAAGIKATKAEVNRIRRAAAILAG